MNLLSRLMESGHIQSVAVETKLPAPFDKKLLENNPHGSRLELRHWNNDYHVFLGTPGAGISTFDVGQYKEGGKRSADPLYVKMINDFDQRRWNYIISRPVVDSNTHSSVSLNIVSPRRDMFGRSGLYWHLNLVCTNDAARDLMSGAPKRHEELFNFFVTHVPGFAELEGRDYKAFSAALKENRESSGPEVRLVAFPSLDAIRAYRRQ